MHGQECISLLNYTLQQKKAELNYEVKSIVNNKNQKEFNVFNNYLNVNEPTQSV